MKLPYVSSKGAMKSLFDETLEVNQKIEEVQREKIRERLEGRPVKKTQVQYTNYVSIDKNGNQTSDPKAVVDVIPASQLRRMERM
ncbi:MAG TPA: hypothetical protein VJI67_01860 [archaeon]|nr:hypothetical protein [archaeon]HLD81119.1 hypothetical protein [archaeon]